MATLTPSQFIAPCGMNCSICRAYLRKRNRCPGCRADDKDKPISRVICKIKTCENLVQQAFTFCHECENYPCFEIKRLDKRYRTKYCMSMIENLESIHLNGLDPFLENEKSRWACPQCGGTICVHKGECSSCGAKSAQRHLPDK